MSIVKNISAGWSFGQDLLKYVIGGVVGLLCGMMACGGETKFKWFAAPGKDTVIERTFFVEREPSQRDIIATKPDTVRDTICENFWDRIPPSAIGTGGDTLSIDSANSCLGQYRGVRITHRKDTVRVRDTIRTTGPRFTLPSLDSLDSLGERYLDFGYSISAGAGPAVGAYGIADIEARAWFRNFMIEVRPQIFVQDKLRAFISATLRYRIK